MIKKLSAFFIGIFMAFSVVAVPVGAQVNVFEACQQNSNSEICKGKDGKLFGPGSVWNNILNTITFIIGAVAVVMIVIGGFRYVISQGDAKAVSDAKNTILYAVVGVIIAVAANAIVNFVLSAI